MQQETTYRNMFERRLRTPERVLSLGAVAKMGGTTLLRRNNDVVNTNFGHFIAERFLAVGSTNGERM